MNDQMSFEDTGGVKVNLSTHPVKAVKCAKCLKGIRSYVETMNRLGRKATNIRISKDDYASFIRELNKKRDRNLPAIIGIHWDGIPVTA